MIEQIHEFAKTIEAMYPQFITRVKEFPSGAAWLYINLDNTGIEMAYSPKDGFGVSIIDDQSFPFVGHDNVFVTFEETKTHILQMLWNAYNKLQ